MGNAVKQEIGLFCDFDGTISENDMIYQIMMRFVPEQATPIIQDVQSQRRTVQAGVEAMFRLIPSHRYEEVVRFAREATRIRAGFAEFVAYCALRNWRFAVVSGGFDFFVEPAITPVRHQVDLYCNRLDTSGEYLGVVWERPCDETCDGGCGLCKPAVLRAYRDRVAKSIVIGDGVTDLKAAKLADVVFARDKLAVTLADIQIPFTKFETFYDILEAVQRMFVEE